MLRERQIGHQPSVGAPYRGIETVIKYNGILLNDRRFTDHYRVTEVTGLDDADVRDSREDNPESDGENAYNSFYSGRTITIRGEIHAGNMSRLREMQADLKYAFNPLEERPLSFIFNDWYDDFSGTSDLVVRDYNFIVGDGNEIVSYDNFNRVVAASAADSWGTPDLGVGPWEISFGGSAANRFSVDGTAAAFQSNTSATSGQRLHPGIKNFDTKAKFKVNALSSDGSIFYGLFGRYRTIGAATDHVRTRVRFNSTGDVLFMLSRDIGGVSTNTSELDTGLTQTTGWWWHRFQAIGDTIKGKVWEDGTDEPDWQLTMTHASIDALTDTDIGVRFATASGTTLPIINVESFEIRSSGGVQINENREMEPLDTSYRSFYVAKTETVDSEIWMRHTTGASVGSYQIGPLSRRIDSDNYVFGLTTGDQVTIWKKDGGSHTLLGATNATQDLAPYTSYWTMFRSTDYRLQVETYQDDNGQVGDLIGSLKHTLSGANATKYGQAKGYSGLGWWDCTSDNATSVINEIDMRSLDDTSDGYVMARKTGKVDMPDVQANKKTHRPFMITMRASDPTIKGRGTKYDSAPASESNLTFPGGGGGLTFPTDGSGLVFTSTTVTINNVGNYYSYPIVRFHGQLTNPSLVNQTTGERLSIETTIASGDYLDVDVLNRTIIDNNGNNQYGYLSEDNEWMRIVAGTNVLGFGVDSYSGSTPSVELFWKYSWL
jgi:hypothetical protein